MKKELTTAQHNAPGLTRKQKQLVKHAYEMKAQTHETDVVFNIYSDSIYILDTEEDNVLEVVFTVEDALETIADMKKEGCKLYFKPILIDNDSGERVTRENFKYYDLKSEWVKKHIKDMEAIDNDEPIFTEFSASDSWVHGQYGLYSFAAKLFDEGSVFGIQNGRVSKLQISSDTEAMAVHYDRGWDVRPKQPHLKAFNKILKFLEAAPKRFAQEDATA